MRELIGVAASRRALQVQHVVVQLPFQHVGTRHFEVRDAVDPIGEGFVRVVQPVREHVLELVHVGVRQPHDDFRHVILHRGLHAGVAQHLRHRRVAEVGVDRIDELAHVDGQREELFGVLLRCSSPPTVKPYAAVRARAEHARIAELLAGIDVEVEDAEFAADDPYRRLGSFRGRDW